MLVTFRTKAYADLLMFGDVAVYLIQLMGHSGAVPGAILADQVPAALDRLRQVAAAHQVRVPKAAVGSLEEDGTDERPIDLAQRAFPLIELLTAAAAAKCDVMWDQ